MNHDKLHPFNNVGRKMVTYGELPLSCPPSDQTLWNAHPRVYLPIAEAGEVICPYCSAHYVLKDFETIKS